MWDVKACLACLSTESKLERITDIFQKLYIALTGIKASDIDGHPMYFCVECYSQIKKALLFKRKCRRAYYVLKEIANVKKQVTLNDITKVNRKRVNLDSLISYSKAGNADLFSIDRVELDVETLIATLDKQDCEEPKCELVKEELLVTGNVWHYDIRPSGLSEPGLEPKYKDDAPVIENTELNNETVPTEDWSEDVFNSNEMNEESEEDFPEPKQKAKEKEHNGKNKFKARRKTSQQITDASVALSKATIRRLRIHEQKAIFELAKTTPDYLKALFKCAMCLTVYDNMDDLVKHVVEHNRYVTSKYICDVCKTKFMDEQDLIVHKGIYHSYQYTCNLCEKATFSTMENYLKHSKQHHTDPVQSKVSEVHMTNNIMGSFEIYPIDRNTVNAKMTHADCQYECKICDMRFMTQEYLNGHMKKHTPLRKSLKCDLCGIFTTSAVSMNRHKDAWHLYVYKCKSCDELLFNKQEAKFHNSQKHKSNPNYHCDTCDKDFRSAIAWRQHCAVTHYSQLFCHHCIECGDSFRTLVDLYKHQLSVHRSISIDDPNTDEKRFPCDSCNVKFLTLKSYQHHALRHGHEVANTFENACTTCRKLFDTAEDYQVHLTTSCRTLHRYPRKCAYCDLTMLNYHKYLHHHKRMHKGIPIWRLRDTQLCELCGQASFDIVEHMKKHGEDEVILECRHCVPPTRLRDVWKYSVHMLTVHTPRPFTCAICLQAYHTRAECKDHILKVHAPENAYRCVTCDQEFSHVDYLNEHCKKFLHSKTEQPKRVATMKRLFIYPHMKLNVSMFDPKVLESVRLFMCDYGKTKREIIRDINDYIVFDKQDELLFESQKRIRYKNKKNKISSVIGSRGEVDPNLYGEKLEIVEEDAAAVNQCDDIDAVFDKEDESPDKRVKEKAENNVKCVKQIDVDLYGRKLETIEYDGIQYDDNDKNIVFDEQDLLPPAKKKRRRRERTKVECTSDFELGLNGQKLNVIEQEGNQYVSINGILYQVVHEE